jgi:DNA-damage-inducible protein D
MLNEIEIVGPTKGFEEIKKIDENGVEYWTARDLFPLLGYLQWKNFFKVIKKAKTACFKSGQNQQDHFSDISKMVFVGSKTVRKIEDFKLDRYACYLIAQNGDPGKSKIALAQTYFAIQTRRQEITEKLSDNEKRLFIRNEVSNQNKKLFKTAKQAGVSNFGSFNDAGYRGLYGSPLSEVEKMKGIKKGELLDRAGATELAANLFRITQTDEKILKDKIKGEGNAKNTHFMVGGKVRQTIKDIGGEMPEKLKSERHIKEIKRESKLIEKGKKKISNV